MNTSNSGIDVISFERRIYKRFKIRRLVYFRTLDKNKNSQLIKLQTLDISSNGMCLEYTNFPFPLNELLNMTVVFTINENVVKILPVDAYVKYVDKKSKRIGVMFYRKIF